MTHTTLNGSCPSWCAGGHDGPDPGHIQHSWVPRPVDALYSTVDVELSSADDEHGAGDPEITLNIRGEVINEAILEPDRARELAATLQMCADLANHAHTTKKAPTTIPAEPDDPHPDRQDDDCPADCAEIPACPDWCSGDHSGDPLTHRSPLRRWDNPTPDETEPVTVEVSLYRGDDYLHPHPVGDIAIDVYVSGDPQIDVTGWLMPDQVRSLARWLLSVAEHADPRHTNGRAQ